MSVSFENDETIAAIATAVAAGQGGIAVIRISGSKAQQIGEEIIQLGGTQKWTSHKILYGHVMGTEGDEHIDEILAFLMKAPRSFTGEDVVEIHCHGGLVTVQRVLARVLEHPHARRALPGEFSQRAVLNGRINLTQAEAISELIAARSHKAAQIAMVGLDGGIQKRINLLRENLLDQLSELEARVDFEDELPPLNGANVLIAVQEVCLELKQLIKDAQRGAILREGVRIAIIGRPNVGKSSLLNRLSCREKAIVTDIPGTTRDLLESEIVIEGVPITLVDTAGIRKTSNKIEKLGIELSHNALLSADIVLMIFDLALGWTKEDNDLFKNIPEGTPNIIIGNKADIQNSKDNPAEIIRFSALTGEGEEALIKELLQTCGANETHNLVAALNYRQTDLAAMAIAALNRMVETADKKLPWDFWTIDLREAIHSLGEITGEEITEAILDRIFSRFCIGK